MRSIKMKFLPKDRVIIDADPDLVAVVTIARLLPDGAPTYRVEWFDSGTAREADVDEFRLSDAPQ